MAKNSLYKKLVRLFKSTIKNYQEVNSELDFTKVEKKILIKKKDNRYYRDIQLFLDYLRRFNDDNALIFFFPESGKKYQRFLEKVESLSARPLEASRQTRSTNNCVDADPYCYQNHDNLDMTEYQNDLQKSPGFFEILNRKQSIDFRFSNTIFSLRGDCISRQGTDNNPQRMCRSDYKWFLKSMAIYFIGKKVRAEAQNQGLNQQNDAAFAQIIRNISSIGDYEQNDKQLKGIFSNSSTTLENINEFELEKFIFNAEYLPNEFKSTFPEGNSSNLLERVNHAVRLKIVELNLKPEESKVFNSLDRERSRPVPETQSVISGVLQKIDINTTPSTSLRSAEDFNWKIIAPVIVGGIGIIVFIVAIIIWYSKKNRSENSESGMELSPLINSIPDRLHVLQIAGRLTKRLGFLEDLSRYDNEIGNHYISFCNANSKEKAIEDLKAIKEALTKFLASKRSSNEDKDKIISNKLESALLIVDSLMQRYYLLSLPNHNLNNNKYITEQIKSALKVLIDSMLNNIQIIRDNFEGTFFSKHNIKKNTSKLIYLDGLLNLEKAIYEAMLSAHAEGYFEKYPRQQVMNCICLYNNTNSEVNHTDLEKIKKLQDELQTTINCILSLSVDLAEEILKLNEINLHNTIKLFIKQLESMKSQLTAYSNFCAGSFSSSTFFGPDSDQKIQSQPQQAVAKCTT